MREMREMREMRGAPAVSGYHERGEWGKRGIEGKSYGIRMISARSRGWWCKQSMIHRFHRFLTGKGIPSGMAD